MSSSTGPVGLRARRPRRPRRSRDTSEWAGGRRTADRPRRRRRGGSWSSLEGSEKGAAACALPSAVQGGPRRRVRTALVAQRIDVRGHRLDLVVGDPAAALGRHRDLGLGFFRGDTARDLLDDGVVGTIAVDPLRVGEVGADGALRVGAVTGVAVALAMEEAVPRAMAARRDPGGAWATAGRTPGTAANASSRPRRVRFFIFAPMGKKGSAQAPAGWREGTPERNRLWTT